ncbi:ATP-dependent RNA helicase dbp6, partial [Kickxella alabastrina]
MGSTKDKKAPKEKRSSEEASKKTKKRSQAMDIVESSAEEQISERKTKKRKSEAAGSADKDKKDKANKKDKTEKDKSAKSKDKKEKKDKKKSKKDKKSKKQSADADTQSGSEPGSDADADADADTDIAVDAEMEGSDNYSAAEQPTQHSEDEPVPDGLQRFPDFSQEATISSSAAQEAARMGIPQWLAQPTTVDRDVTAPANDPRFGLSGHILGQCSKAGIDQLFAVQSAVIPVLRAAHSLSRLRQHVRDVCVSAPTGSGKTLAFVIPIVEKLRARVVVRLRALVVLPTKELAQQVKESFDFFCVGTDLRVGLATGDMSLGKEQAALVVGGSGSAASGGSSRVDILVCTPGRLLDHLAMTRGFTLQHLEFWVMDEADRLLGEAYQEWLPKVQAAIEAEAEPEAEAGTGLGEHGVPTADA